MAETAARVAAAHYRQQQAVVRATAETAQRIWGSVRIDALDESWRTAGLLLVQTMSDGQRQAAAPADAYVAAALSAGGTTGAPGGRLNTGAFVGRTADGRSLLTLLYEPWIETRWRLAAGQMGSDALAGGLATLIRQVATEIPDAGRGAVGASLAGNVHASGYTRVLTPPSCSRCTILAGRHYRYSSGFQRHPHCDCVHLPVGGRLEDHHVIDPESYFHGLSRTEQDRIFTIAGAQAIRDGADITRVVNARRGMYTADAYGQRLASTYDSTTRRGAFARAERQRAIERGLIPPSGAGFRLTAPRLLPEEIYRRAESRDQLIAMLRRYGYFVD